MRRVGETPLPRSVPFDGLAASRLQLPPGTWTTVLDCLCDRFPAIPRSAWIDRFRRGRVLDAHGVALTLDAVFRVGLEIRYFREVANETAIPFAERIVYADADLVVADKPHFLPVTPAGAYVHETLLARLMRRLGTLDLVPLHRIDRDTAGLVLFSSNAASRDAYQALFRERRIVKRYEAIAPALPGLEFPLRRVTRLAAGEPFFRRREVAGEANSETCIDVIARDSPLWRYSLVPITGRSHQLRVHMAALGAPILNDPIYSEPDRRARDDHSRPLKLLAAELSFIDPVSGAARRFESQFRL